MISNRRQFITAAATAGTSALAAQGPATSRMYGLIGQMKAVPGKRDALIAALLQGTESMPGCLGYVIAKDTHNEDVIWITEVWDSKESHDASLSLPAVRKTITLARPMIAAFEAPQVVEPVGGVGLPKLDVAGSTPVSRSRTSL